MSFPYVFESNFERGTNGDWDSETDGASPKQLDFPHYSELAGLPWSTAAPYSGAYCARLVLTGQTGDAVVKEADINIANTVTNYFAFDIWFAPDFTGTANDTFAILELIGSAVTGSVGARIVASTNVINLGIGASATGTAPTQFTSFAIERGVWYTVESKFNIQTGGSGTADLFVTRRDSVTAKATADASLTSVTNVAVTDGWFGIQDHAATTTGTFLLDNFVQDDARVYPTKRYPRQRTLTQSGHVFVGPGHIDGAALITDEATNKMVLWDTDKANVDSTQDWVVELELDNQTAISGPVFFQHGCYAELFGTDPRGQVLLLSSSDRPGVTGPKYYTDAMVRRLGILG